MKYTLKELIKPLSFDVQTPVAIGNVKRLMEQWSIDFDVYLPSLDVNLQRPRVWTLKQKQQFIMQMIADVPMNPLSLIMNYDNKTIQVIDGKQRLTTIFDFVNNEFPINFNGRDIYFNDIEDNRYFLLYTLRAYIVYNETNTEMLSDEQKIEWFLFVNNSGTPMQVEHLNQLETLII